MTPELKLVTFSTASIASYAAPTATVNRRYCKRHRYAFVHEQYENVGLAPQHEKVRVLQKHLGTARTVVWVDADACVINFTQKLEPFLASGKDLVISGHQFGFDLAGRRTRYVLNGLPAGVNTGVMLLRDSEWSRRFLEAWWINCQMGQLEGTAFHEQGQLQQMLMANAVDIQNHVDIVTPPSRLNRGDDDGRDVCDFILHLWGSTPELRKTAFSEVAGGRKPDLGIAMPFFDLGMR